MLEKSKLVVIKVLPNLKLELDENQRFLQQLEESKTTISIRRYKQLKEAYLIKIEDLESKIKKLTNDINNELIETKLQSEKITVKIKNTLDAMNETELLFNKKVVSVIDYKNEKKRSKKQLSILDKEKHFTDKIREELELYLYAKGQISLKQPKLKGQFLPKWCRKKTNLSRKFSFKPLILAILILVSVVISIRLITSKKLKYNDLVLSYNDLKKIGETAYQFYIIPISHGGPGKDFNKLLEMKGEWIPDDISNVSCSKKNDYSIFLNAHYNEFTWELEINRGGKITKIKDDGSPIQNIFTAIEDSDYKLFKETYKELRVDPNTLNIWGEVEYPSLLSVASKSGQINIVKYLLKMGANSNLPDKSLYAGVSGYPIMKASGNNHYNIVKLLLKNGADPNKMDGWCNDAIQIASREGSYKIVNLLLEYGADPNSANGIGFSALYDAATRGHLEIVKLLTKKGAKINPENKYEESPLAGACSNEHFDVIKFLVEKGADWEIGSKNYTPFDYALKSKNKKIVSYFKNLKKEKLKKGCLKLTKKSILADYYEYKSYSFGGLTLNKNKTFDFRDGAFMFSGIWEIDNDEIILSANWAGGTGNMGDEYSVEDVFEFGVKKLNNDTIQTIILLFAKTDLYMDTAVGDKFNYRDKPGY